MHKHCKSSKQGFTIVELLIVVVVIAILAAISVVAYTGIQQRARDSKRKIDLAAIAKAVELYRTDNGHYPPASSGGWCTQLSHPSHSQLRTALSPYMGPLPKDPLYTDTYQDYFYRNNAGNSYDLYAQVEGSGNGSYSTGSCSVIDSKPNSYNYAYGRS